MSYVVRYHRISDHFYHGIPAASRKSHTCVRFVCLPIIGALINGFSISEIADFVTKGCSTVWPMAALFVFTVTYFDLMADVGLFDKVVEKNPSRSQTEM